MTTPSAEAMEAALKASHEYASVVSGMSVTVPDVRAGVLAAYAIDARPTPLTVERLAALLEEMEQTVHVSGEDRQSWRAAWLLPHLTGVID